MEKKHDFVDDLLETIGWLAIGYFLLLIIGGILKLVWWLTREIWQLIEQIWFWIVKSARPKDRFNDLKSTLQIFFLKHRRLNKIVASVRADIGIICQSKPTALLDLFILSSKKLFYGSPAQSHNSS